MDDVVIVGGKRFTVKRVAASCKNASARVRENTIIVKIPLSLPREEGFALYRELKNKVIAKLEKEPEKFAAPRKLEFRDGQEATVLGKTFKVIVKQGGSASSSAKLVGDAVVVTLAAGLDEKTHGEHVSNLSRRVISHSLLPLVSARVLELNEKHFRFAVRKVFVKEHLSKWGSCSEKSNVNLSFKLLFAPQEIIDYVIVHELAHLKEKKHSQAFWSLVAAAVPDYKQKRRWLAENGVTLGAASSAASFSEARASALEASLNAFG